MRLNALNTRTLFKKNECDKQLNIPGSHQANKKKV